MVSGVHIRNAETPDDRARVQALLQAAFEVRPGVGAAFAQVYAQVAQTPSVHSRMAVINGQVVGHALLARRSFAMEDAIISGGIVAMVAVDATWRKRGIGSALVQDIEALARQEKIQMLHLAGDLRFYGRFGFAPGYVRAKAEMAIASGTGNLRSATVADAPVLACLSAHETPMGAVVADEARWCRVLETQHPALLLYCNDQLLGFCARGDACVLLGTEAFARCCWNAQTLAVYEAAAQTNIAAEQLHDALHGWAQKRGCVHMAFHLPPDNRLAQTGTARKAVWTVGEDAELLVKVLDVQGLMQAMKAVLAHRIEQAQWKGTLELRVGEVCMNVGQKREGWRLSLSEMGFARAILGLGRLATYVKTGDGELTNGLNALFPERHPFFWLADSL